MTRAVEPDPGLKPYISPMSLKERTTTGAVRQGKGIILLAEDEPLLRELGETILTQAGYTILTASTGDGLRDLLKTHRGTIDLLLTDVVMPEIPGPELVRMARERWPKVKVLYMSGYSDSELKDLGQNAAFIQKPFTPAELTAKIAEILSQGS